MAIPFQSEIEVPTIKFKQSTASSVPTTLAARTLGFWEDNIFFGNSQNKPVYIPSLSKSFFYRMPHGGYGYLINISKNKLSLRQTFPYTSGDADVTSGDQIVGIGNATLEESNMQGASTGRTLYLLYAAGFFYTGTYGASIQNGGVCGTWS